MTWMDLKTVFELDDSDQKLESINISNHRKQITKAIAKLLSKMAEGIKMTLVSVYSFDVCPLFHWI